MPDSYPFLTQFGYNIFVDAVWKVGIVDDDETVVEALGALLASEGFEPVPIGCWGQPIADQVAQAQPDLVMLDMWLSGLDGRDVCMELKSRQDTQHIPVLLISASQEVAAAAREAGADAYMEKPFDVPDLLQQVQSLVVRH